MIVAAFYHFAELPDYVQRREPLRAACEKAGVRGSILLAAEGINGTIAGTRDGIDTVLDWLRSDPRLADLEHKESTADAAPFQRLKIKLKREIVSMGVPEANPARSVGEYLDPAQWDALTADPEVLVIDTRNDYEVKLGQFAGAVAPGTQHFREFPDYVRRELAAHKQRPIAMYCTGGIRCEKATAYLRDQGYEQVYHLRGGILKYLETVPAARSRWQGECYVFDERVAVGHGLRQGAAVQCEGCGLPLTRDEQQLADFEPGICCPHCKPGLSAERRASLEMRRSQKTGGA